MVLIRCRLVWRILPLKPRFCTKTLVSLIKTMVLVTKSLDSISNPWLCIKTLVLKRFYVQNVRVKPWFCSESKVSMNYCAKGLPYSRQNYGFVCNLWKTVCTIIHRNPRFRTKPWFYTDILHIKL